MNYHLLRAVSEDLPVLDYNTEDGDLLIHSLKYVLFAWIELIFVDLDFLFYSDSIHKFLDLLNYNLLLYLVGGGGAKIFIKPFSYFKKKN